jgi:CHC2-type zinc finger protein
VSDLEALSQLDQYLQQLTGGARPGQQLELRWMPSEQPMRRRFVSARSLARARQMILARRELADVYVGVALRDRRSGHKRAITGSRLVFVECDRIPDPDLLDVLPPTIEIASGTRGHRHLYWSLDAPAPTDRVERANRALALALGGDIRCVDLGRILRPPETLNHKHDPPRPVHLLALRNERRYSLAELLNTVPVAEEPAGSVAHVPPSTRAPLTALDRRLRAIPAGQYVLVLTGRRPNRQGKVLCPFHEERHASLHLYPDGSFYCYGCRRGGSIIDFAAALWGRSARGVEFLELREQLARRFGLIKDD